MGFYQIFIWDGAPTPTLHPTPTRTPPWDSDAETSTSFLASPIKV